MQSNSMALSASKSTTSAAALNSTVISHSAPRGAIWNLTNKAFFGVPQAMSDIRRKEGIRALWSGLGPNLVGVMPARAIYFATYSLTKQRLSDFLGGESDIVYVASAAAAGATCSIATNPIWMVKTRMQLQEKGTYKNSFDCFFKVARTEGIRALYRGLGASFLGIAESSLQWIIYERLRRRDQENANKSAGASAGSSFFYAAAAKLIAASIAYPHEVVRTRLRQEPQRGGHREFTGIWQTFRQTAAKEGLKGLYGGLSAHLIRVVPNAAIVFLFYESTVALGRKSLAT